MRTSVFGGLTLVVGLVLAGPAGAQPPDPASAQAIRAELDRLKQELGLLQQQYEGRLAALEARLATLEASPADAAPANAPAPTAQVPAGAAGGGGPAGALPVYGGAAAASKIFNPDIAVIGDVLGAAGRNRVAPASPFEVHESEASFQAIVDPYARADFFISFGEEGVELEEGYMTFPALPGGLLMRVGKMRGAFGKVNTLHNHVLPWTDRPVVIENLLGGEDGISDAGLSVARLIPNPWVFLEATGQVFRGTSGVFTSSAPSHLTYLGHLRGYQDLTESSNVDLGLSSSSLPSGRTARTRSEEGSSLCDGGKRLARPHWSWRSRFRRPRSHRSTW